MSRALELLPSDETDENRVELRVVSDLVLESNGDAPVPGEASDEPPPELDEAASSQDPLTLYLNEIGKIPLLTAEEEVDLAKRIDAGVYARAKLEILTAKDQRAVALKLGRLVSVKNKEVEHPEVSAALYERTRLKGWHTTRRQQYKHDLRGVVKDGERAKNELTRANLRLVVHMAERYTGKGMAFLDLIQEGNKGLIRAVEGFDYTKGYKFSTYAAWWIRRDLQRGLANQSRTVRLPEELLRVVNELGRTQRELSQGLRREPTLEELSKEVDLTPEKVLEIQDLAREPVSFDQPVGSKDSDGYLGEYIVDSQASRAMSEAGEPTLQERLDSMLDTFPELEASVFRWLSGMVDGHKRNSQEVGVAHGITPAEARQIEKRVMTKLRHPSRSHVLLDYLEG